MSGWEAGARLRELGLQAEMCDIYRVVLIATVMDGSERLDGVCRAFAKLSELKKPHPFNRRMGALPAVGEAAMTLRQAWLSDAKEAALRDSSGRIAADAFGAYPPGIPLCMPGEIISKEIIAAVLEAQSLGGKFFGVREGKITVVK
jgi:arginine/lysine/ornithine decarboxylase